MKQTAFFVLACSLLCATGCSAADHDFDSVVAGVQQQYSVRAQRIPFMGLVSLCARLKTHGGVAGMRVAEFDNLHGAAALDLASLLHAQLGDQWQPFVAEREKGNGKGDANQSVIFVRLESSSMRMMIADYDHGELDLVRMEVHGKALANWMHDPETRSHYSRPGHSSSATTD